MTKTLACLMLMLISFIATPAFAKDISAQKAVLITGASSGIGRLTAEHLAKAGYFVYAGARKPTDIQELNKIDNVRAIRLDVTVQEEIDAAVKIVKEEGRGLWGLVNNAGINIIDPLIEGDVSDLQFLFDVNVFGIYRVTQAFAPLIIESKGRIVNISSIAGILSGGLTGYGGYMMSKHAVESYTDQLAFEMAGLGVRVSAIEPGSFRSEIGMSRCKRMVAGSDAKEYEYFAKEMQVYLDSCKELVAKNEVSYGQPPEKVALAIEHAISAEAPKEHYLVAAEQFEAMITIRKSFEELLNLNHDQEFSYSREQLIELMDEEWAILKGEKSRDWGDGD